jgi:uncharacterized protein YaaN involved in tellurite resistance
MTTEEALKILAQIIDKSATGPKQMFIDAQVAIDTLKKAIEPKKE